MFGADIEVDGGPTKGTTGALEVQIVGGALLHSKLGGDGYIDSQAKKDKIFNGVREALSKA